MLVSAVAIGGLAVLLSPYILVAGAVFGLIYGLPQLPPPFNALVPAPVVEVRAGLAAATHAIRLCLTCSAAQAEHKLEQFSRFLRVQAPAHISPALFEQTLPVCLCIFCCVSKASAQPGCGAG